MEHGTPSGYDNGCRTGADCPNQHTKAMTCLAAHIRFQGDYAYRKCILAGEVWVEPITPKKRAVTVSMPAKSTTILIHGTVTGYRKGCRKPEDCPNKAEGTTTCNAANSEAARKHREAKRDERNAYQREYYRARKLRDAASLPQRQSA